MERLKKYPMWKVDKLSEYSGPLTNQVFQYLDQLNSRQTQSATYDAREDLGYTKQLPDTKNYSQLEKECGAKLFAGLKEIMATAPKGTAKQKISELHAQLRGEYPQFAHSLKC